MNPLTLLMVTQVRLINRIRRYHIVFLAVSVSDNVSKLAALGFKAEDCVMALQYCEEKVDDAALWLTQNAIPIHNYTSSIKSNKEENRDFIKTVEVKANGLSLCIIDDCGDADVPLLEISMSEVHLRQKLNVLSEDVDEDHPERGSLECILASDYYNRLLSGWEPILEPWK